MADAATAAADYSRENTGITGRASSVLVVTLRISVYAMNDIKKWLKQEYGCGVSHEPNRRGD